MTCAMGTLKVCVGERFKVRFLLNVVVPVGC